MTPLFRKRQRTMSIGGITYDLFVRADPSRLRENVEARTLDLPLGAKIRVEEIVETCGGGASNTAVGLRRLGCRASFCGVVGSDQWGERLLQNLQSERVNTRSATVVEGEVSSSSIILSVSSGERIILYDPGTNAHLRRITFDRDATKRTDWIYLNHLHEDSSVINEELIRILEDRTKTINFTWNPGEPQVRAGISSRENKHLLAHTTLLLLNKEEATTFAKTENIEQAINFFHSAGAHFVCITDGGNGALGSDGKHLYRCPVIESAPVVDTTGAGDAFGVGCTWALLQGLTLPNTLRAGTINATSVLGFLGAQEGLLTDIEMQKRLSSLDLPVQVLHERS